MFLIVVFGVAVYLIYLLATKKHNYWKNKGVKYDKAVPFVGSISRVFLQKVNFAQYLEELYRKYPNEKFVGYFGGHAVSLLLRDPELIKHVLVSDFNCFYARGLNHHKTVLEPMMKNLFFADGDLWKLLRQRLTPAFTSGKLKAMFPLIAERTERLQQIARVDAERGVEVDVRDLMARYTTDFIGVCGFGIDADSIDDENSTFRQLGKQIFTVTPRATIVQGLRWMFPETFKHLHTLQPGVETKTVSIVKSIMEQRNYKPSPRNDFIDLFFELKEKGVIVGESLEKKNPDGTPQMAELELDDLLIAAQVFIFFAAGFETSSSAAGYTLHQLACHPEAQRKCQQEIDDVLSRYDNKLCYDAVKEMKYLEMCFKEGIRMFPSVGFLIRKCARQYTFPGTDLTIDEGVYVLVPVQALHNDEKYFEEPEKFIPERFSAERVNSIPNHVYFPFGGGPRACIGIRLFPSLGCLKRGSVRPYQIPGTSVTIDPDVDIIIPVNGLHRDPQYWAEPDRFVPERFEDGPPHKFVYLPFGEGPRACVGERLGRMQYLAGLAALLRGFSVEPAPSTCREPPRDPTTIVVQSVLGGIPLKVRRRNLKL